MNQIDSIQFRQSDSNNLQQSDSNQPTPVAVAPTPVHVHVPLTAVPPTTPRNQEALMMLLRPADSLMEVEHPDTTLQLAIDLEGQLAHYKDMPVVKRESLFSQSEQPDGSGTVQMREQQENYFWSFGIVILLLGIMSLYLHNRKFKIKELAQSLFDGRALDRMFRENNLKPRSFLPMALLYVASTSLTATMLGARWVQLDTPFPMLINYLLIFAGLTLFIILRAGFIRLFGNIFEERESIDLYITNCYLYYFWGAAISVPLSLILLYGPQAAHTSLYILAVFVFIIFIIRIFRGFQLFLTNSKSGKLYLFYYLCIFEIIPILVFAKLLIW